MIKEYLKTNPIMAAVKYDEIEEALSSKASIIVLMNGKLSDLMEGKLAEWNKQKPIFIHMDLLKGLHPDAESMMFIKNHVKVSGIVSTKNNTLRNAKKEGLLTIQRIFLIDTRSLNNSINSVLETKSDAVEIMPAIAYPIIKTFKEKVDIPIIMSGLISSEQIVYEALSNGAEGISMSKKELWNLEVSSK